MERKARASETLRILKKTYPEAHCELDYKNPLQLLIATILSAQCTDVRVNMVTPALFKKYPSAEDYLTATQEDIEELIHSTGFYKSKAKAILSACKDIVEKHGGEVPANMDDLKALRGVGRKTANVVLGNAFNINEGIVVDTHVSRLSQRLGFTRHKDPVKIEKVLVTLFPRDDWTLFSHLLIWHGRRRCPARKPRCVECELAHLCPSAKSPLAKA